LAAFMDIANKDYPEGQQLPQCLAFIIRSLDQLAKMLVEHQKAASRKAQARSASSTLGRFSYALKEHLGFTDIRAAIEALDNACVPASRLSLRPKDFRSASAAFQRVADAGRFEDLLGFEVLPLAIRALKTLINRLAWRYTPRIPSSPTRLSRQPYDALDFVKDIYVPPPPRPSWRAGPHVEASKLRRKVVFFWARDWMFRKRLGKPPKAWPIPDEPEDAPKQTAGRIQAARLKHERKSKLMHEGEEWAVRVLKAKRQQQANTGHPAKEHRSSLEMRGHKEQEVFVTRLNFAMESPVDRWRAAPSQVKDFAADESALEPVSEEQQAAADKAHIKIVVKRKRLPAEAPLHSQPSKEETSIPQLPTRPPPPVPCVRADTPAPEPFEPVTVAKGVSSGYSWSLPLKFTARKAPGPSGLREVASVDDAPDAATSLPIRQSRKGLKGGKRLHASQMRVVERPDDDDYDDDDFSDSDDSEDDLLLSSSSDLTECSDDGTVSLNGEMNWEKTRSEQPAASQLRGRQPAIASDAVQDRTPSPRLKVANYLREMELHQKFPGERREIEALDPLDVVLDSIEVDDWTDRLENAVQSRRPTLEYIKTVTAEKNKMWWYLDSLSARTIDSPSNHREMMRRINARKVKMGLAAGCRTPVSLGGEDEPGGAADRMAFTAGEVRPRADGRGGVPGVSGALKRKMDAYREEYWGAHEPPYKSPRKSPCAEPARNRGVKRPREEMENGESVDDDV